MVAELSNKPLSSLVTVRRRVRLKTSRLLSLDDMDYLRQGLWLQLESARLALMRNDDQRSGYRLPGQDGR